MGHVRLAGQDDSRLGMLRLFGVNVEAWCRRHGVEPFTAPCSECGTALTASIPFAWRGMRGLTAPDCRCGNQRPPYCIAWHTLPR